MRREGTREGTQECTRGGTGIRPKIKSVNLGGNQAKIEVLTFWPKIDHTTAKFWPENSQNSNFVIC